MEKRAAVMITHTHWDREWYLSLDQYRFRLVRLLDGLLEILATESDYHSFWLDGQTIPLDDYLAVRPEKREEVTAALGAGKLLIGPWMVQADEFMVSGESCIRNLMMGMRRMQAVGQENLVGYLADNFGHPSQMPQILRGFGIDNAVFWRGYKVEDLDGAEQTWTGADGSRVIAVCLVRGYSNSAHLLAMTGDEAVDGQPDRLQDSLETLRKYCVNGPILLMNGIDHALATRDIARHIKRLEEIHPDLKIRHGSLSEYVAQLRGKALPEDKLRGELRYVPTLDSTGSSRVYHKLANSRVEDLLIHYAEPLSALAACRGGAPAAGFLRRAWELLVKNHAHDSISSSHSDNVAQDVDVRFRRAEEVGQGVVRESLERLTGQVASMTEVAEPLHVWIFQPCGWERSGPFELELDLCADTPPTRTSLTRHGQAFPCQIVSLHQTSRIRFHKHINPTYQDVFRVRVLVDPGKVAAASLTRFGISVETAPVPAPTEGLSPEWGVLDNGTVRAAIHADGSFDLTDLRSGLAAPGLNRLVDEPDIGDLYQSAQPVDGGQTVAANGAIEQMENGPLRSAYRIRTCIMAADVEVPVAIWLSLASGEDFVRIRVEVENCARDHRLRACFSLPAGMARTWAHTPFDVVERQRAEPVYAWFNERPDARFEKNGTLKPMQTFVAAAGDLGALFVLSRGLYEYHRASEDVLSLTLFRAANTIFRHFSMYRTETAECQRALELNYAVGLTGAAAPAALLRRAKEFRLPPICYQVFGKGLPGDAVQICSVSRDDWIVSAAKQPERGQGLVVRLFSLAAEPCDGALTAGVPVSRAFLTRLDEEREEELALEGQTVRLTLSPKKIATVLFERIQS